MAESLRTTVTADGRVLAFALWGDPEGFPVMSLHGTPGCRFYRWPNEELYHRLGVCLVTHDRAGYGRSARRRGRCVADEVEDVIAIADHLGFDRFAVTGGSGGGPHALACAALLPDRVVRVTCLVGVAPLGSSGLDVDSWLSGMDAENVKEFGWSMDGEEVLSVELEREYALMVERVALDPATMLDSFDLSDSDREALARPEMVQVNREAIPELGVNGVWGWVDDDLESVRPWGFAVGDIAVPVLVWYGSADVLVPPAHGEWLAAHVPGCIVKVDCSGHLGSDPELEITQNLLWLRDGIPPSDSR
jgi:pimeloyl-ACP methyl ester carboxylesterase